MLPANDAIPLDIMKLNVLQVIFNKNVNLVAMNLLTVMLCDMDTMMLLIYSTKMKDLLDWLTWKLIKNLCTKFKLGDTIAPAEQLEKLMKLTLKKKQDPEYLKSKIASLKTNYGCQIEEKLKTVAIVKAGGKQYAADTCSNDKKGLVVTS